MTYNTNNPLGSNDFRDLSDNAEYFDKYVGGPQPAYPNRFGALKLSIEGQQQAFISAQNGRQSQFEAQLGAMGYTWVGDYGPGLLFTSRNQYMVRDGVPYAVDNTTTLPYTSTGNWALEVSKFKVINIDDILRTDFAQPDGVALANGAIRVFDTVAALRAADISKPATSAQCLGYYAKGDGGGGPVRYLVTGQPGGTFVDNGGSVVVPTGGTGSAAWLWAYSGPINLKWFGGTTNPLIDNAPIILKAVQNGTTLLIPRGDTFAVSGVMILNKSNFRVTGGGTLRLMDASNKPVLGATDCTSFAFDGMRINGNKLNQTETVERNNGSCLFAYRCADFDISNNFAEDGYSGAMVLAVDNAANPTEVKTNGRIKYNTLINGGVVGGLPAMLCDGIFANSDNTEIVGNIIDGVTDYGIAADYSRKLIIDKNIVRNAAFVHIGCVGGKTWQITNNILDGAGVGIVVSLSGNPPSAPYLSDDILIAGNQIANVVAVGALLGDGIFVDPSATNVKIRNNSVRNGTRGIASSATGIIMTDNDVTDMTGRGIFASGAGSFLSGNTSLRCAGGDYYGDVLSDKTLLENAPTNGFAASSLQNSWLDYGVPYDTVGYRRQAGICRLRGVAKSGTVGAIIFTLPVAYRPKTTERWAIPGDSAGGVAQIIVNTDGTVRHVSGPVTEVHLKNISFAVA